MNFATYIPVPDKLRTNLNQLHEQAAKRPVLDFSLPSLTPCPSMRKLVSGHDNKKPKNCKIKSPFGDLGGLADSALNVQ